MSIKFFVVEDHTLMSRGIQEFLQHDPEFVCLGAAADKEHAVERLCRLYDESNLPDILILDLFLGSESGLDLLREVKATYPSIKVVMYSMCSNPGIISLALEIGAGGFVSKAASESELITAAKQVYKGSPYVTSEFMAALFTYKNLMDSLTKQERNILNKVIERKDSYEIAQELNLNIRSIENYLSRIYSKTGCRGHEELIEKFG